MSHRVQLYSLGLQPYNRALELQEKLVEARKEQRIGDTLLLLNHPHVITLGRASSDQFLRYPRQQLAERGYPVVAAGRGGEITYHGPGQLIAYPIMKLEDEQRDLHSYLRKLEEVGIRILSDLGLEGERVKGRTGVWVEGRKVAAIGVRARSWVTFHGMAINRTRDLRGFDYIVPCGLSDADVTSLEDLLGHELSTERLEALFRKRFAEVFQREVESKEETELSEFLGQ